MKALGPLIPNMQNIACGPHGSLAKCVQTEGGCVRHSKCTAQSSRQPHSKLILFDQPCIKMYGKGSTLLFFGSRFRGDPGSCAIFLQILNLEIKSFPTSLRTSHSGSGNRFSTPRARDTNLHIRGTNSRGRPVKHHVATHTHTHTHMHICTHTTRRTHTHTHQNTHCLITGGERHGPL